LYRYRSVMTARRQQAVGAGDVRWRGECARPVPRSCCGGGGIATLCYRGMSDRVEGGVMSTIPHRELRNNSTEILRRVEKGETFSITNHGRTVARLIPYTASPLDVLRESGRVTGAKKVDLAALPAAHGLSSKDVLDDLRGER